MKLIYIAGPYRGANAWEVEQNIRRAEEIGFEVASAGAIPLIPHTMYRFWDGTLDDRFWLACGIKLLEQCDAIVLCPGWTGSKGSMAERDHASVIGIPDFEYVGTEPMHLDLGRWIGSLMSAEQGRPAPVAGKQVSLSTSIKANASMIRKAKRDR